VAAGRGESLQVGLDPGASARVGGGDRQTTWRQNSPFAGITRIRFAGVISALGGHPGTTILLLRRIFTARPQIITGPMIHS
jgi:hypothetical protein